MTNKLLNHEFFMQKAYQQAQLAYENGEVPIGALLVKDYEIVTSSYNQTLTLSETILLEYNII